MRKILFGMILCAAACGPMAAQADPPTLKFNFNGSDTDSTWASAMGPYIAAVNADPSHAVHIDGYLNGALGRDATQQPQMVLDGVADIAFTIPGIMPGRFPDEGVFFLPGIWRDVHESTIVHQKLIDSGSLRGFSNFVVLAGLGDTVFSVHSRVPIASYKDLKGLKVKVVDPTSGMAAKALGMVPLVMSAPETAEAVARGTVDAVLASPEQLVDFGMDKVTSYDYFITFGIGPLAIIMNKQKFDGLPADAQAVLKKYSGAWMGDRFAKNAEEDEKAILDRWKADPKRHLIYPSPQEQQQVQSIVQPVVDGWMAKDPHNAALLEKTKALLAEVRAGQ